MNSPDTEPTQMDIAQAEVRAVTADLIRKEGNRDNLVVIIDDGIQPELVFEALAKRDIDVHTVSLIKRSEATQEQLEASEFIVRNITEDAERAHRTLKAGALLAQYAVGVSAMLGGHSEMWRTKGRQEDSRKWRERRHNDPELAAHYREERRARQAELASIRAARKARKNA